MRIKLLSLFLLFPVIINFSFDKTNIQEKNPNPPDNPVALVKKVHKVVDYRKSAQQTDWEKAVIGLILNNGNEIKTGPKSLALIYFTDGSGLLRVRENSILHIYGDKKERKLNKNTFIQKGLIGFDVNKQAEDEEFKFTTPTVVASIRGTSGFIDYSEDSTFTMSLDSGSALLNFLGPQGGEGTLTEGNTVVITSDGNFEFHQQTDEDKNKSNETKKTNVKKLIIRTTQGNVEIEYYAPEE
ncbi:MAG: FecR family protein [Melioribacter sp.]|uniref:FecR family protein n=1 Tax=Rosettibacter primus TaxID=3111523 RepID=UPI00247DFCD2|nr:FecR family protein [Melioribacter sp.]